MLSRILSQESRTKYVNILFHAALTIELLLMVAEKSEVPLGFESHVFRVTFLLTLLAVALMQHDKKEWAVLAAVFVFTGICYFISGKNDLLRFSAFLFAARDIDLKKTMKYSFFVCAVGFAVIALLSGAGILGDVIQVADFGRGNEEERRLVLGFGHPNTLLGCVFALVLMLLWLYGDKASFLWYLAITVASCFIAVGTRSRTGILMLAATLAMAIVLRLFPGLKNVTPLYYFSALITPVMCVLSAVLAAGYAENAYTGGGIPIHNEELFWKIDFMLTNRISNLYYGVPQHGGILSNWKLMAGRGADGYFDMGWARLFYWYGILPAALISLAIAALIYVCLKKRDMWTVLIILSLSVYTITEATFVSRYIGRSFYLLIAGVYLGQLIKGIKND